MPKYLISFNDGDMQFDREELPQVAEDAHAVMRDAIAQGVWVFGGGFEGFQTKVVNSRGDVSDGPLAPSDVVLGGFSVIDVADDDAAHEWAGANCQSLPLRSRGASLHG